MSKAIQYKFSIPNYLAVRAADKLPGKWLETGRLPGLSEIERAPVPLPESGLCPAQTAHVRHLRKRYLRADQPQRSSAHPVHVIPVHARA